MQKIEENNKSLQPWYMILPVYFSSCQTEYAQQNVVEIGYKVMKEILGRYNRGLNIMVNSDEWIVTTNYLTLQARCYINRCIF